MNYTFDVDEEEWDVSADIDLNSPEDSTFYINDNKVCDWIDGVYGDSPLEELIGIYQVDGNDGKRNPNDAMLNYLYDNNL